MPKKPDKRILEAAKKKLDPKDVLNAVVNDIPDLADELVRKGLAREV